MIYELKFFAQAEKDIAILKKSNIMSYNKVVKLLLELMEHPQTGTGKPEKMKYNPLEWSRRIDQKNRLVYSIDADIVTVTVISALGHYGDK